MFLRFILLFLFLNESIHSFYLPEKWRIKRQTRIRRAHTYLEQYGYFESAPICQYHQQNIFACAITSPQVTKITDEEALKKFQKNAGIKETGEIDEATIEMMEKPRCGNSDIQTPQVKNSAMWKKRTITYAFLNYTNQLEKPILRKALSVAFDMWTFIAPFSFVESRDTKNADIQILFAKGNHGDDTPFDAQVYAHGNPDGRLHFNEDQKWRYYDVGDEVIWEHKDLVVVAAHEIGHILGLEHSSTEGSIMTYAYRSPVKREDDARKYFMITPIINDVLNLQAIYGTKISKAAKSKLLSNIECSEFCFI